ncbi:MAG TPA: TadE family protein [Allosphingosinicella sp.]
MIRATVLPRLARDARGATIIEFAMILPALCLVLMGTFELGYRMYVSSVLQGALHEAARMATVGTMSTTQIDTHVKQKLRSFSHAATITTSVDSYDEFTQVNVPERISQDTVPLGQYNVGDCYEDYNNNQRYDLDRARSGLGQADDIVRYRVSISYPRMFPVAGFFGWSDTDTIVSDTVLRNQPYAGRVNPTPVVRCS